MKNRKLFIIRLIVAVVVMCIAVGLGILVSSGKSPVESVFSGEIAHDFGDAVIEGPLLKLSHTFKLTNQTDQTVNINGIAASCGCTVGKVSKDKVPPGETVEVVVALSLTDPGYKEEKIWLDLGELDFQTLMVSGTGKRRFNVYASNNAVLLEPGTSQEVIVVATNLFSDEMPEELSFNSPDGVEADFKGWKKVYAKDDAMGRPSRWHGLVSFTQTNDEPLSPRTKAVIGLGKENDLSIDLTGWPWQ